MTTESTGERLQKLIAQVGITSRRNAEDLIREGRVTVNGKTAKLGDKATLGTDAIKVNGKLIQVAANKVYYLIYKPKNMIAMIAEDEEGRPTLKDLTKRIKERVYTVGRMDFTGEGAILLTNDGDFAQKLQKSTDVIRRYQVKVDRHPSAEDLEKLSRGGRIEGRSMQPFHVRVANAYARNSLIEVSFEGMGQIDIKKFFENKGFFPEKIARIAIGHLSVEKMAPGTYKRIEPSSIQALFIQPELTKKQIERAIEKGSNYKFKTEEAAKEEERMRRANKTAPGEAKFVTARKTIERKAASEPYKSPARSAPHANDRPARGERSFTPRFANEGTSPRGERAPRSFERSSRTFEPKTERSLERSYERSSEQTASPSSARSFGGKPAARGGFARPSTRSSGGRPGSSAGASAGGRNFRPGSASPASRGGRPSASKAGGRPSKR